MHLLSSLLVLGVSPLLHALSVPIRNDVHDHDHPHVEHARLPNDWYQPEGHRAAKLFRRAPDDGVPRPAVGSAEWLAQFPAGRPDVSQLPQAWVDALQAAVDAGRIPDIVQSRSLAPDTNPVYPAGVNPVSPEICSATYRCQHPDDHWDAPAGVFASSFDDGPEPAGAQLVEFLQSQDVKTTHFMIGINIRQYPQLFLQTFDAGGDIAVHTYNHLYMTTLTNLEVVAQLGWTMQIIHESTGGRVPRFWRPPFGDSDNRVRAIAMEVFGMETVIWNRDSQDWGLESGATTQEDIHTWMGEWLSGPKSPGLVVLQHERAEGTVAAFINAFPLIAQNGWRFESLAAVYGGGAYQNALSSTSDDVREASIVDGAGGSGGNNSPPPPAPPVTTPTPTTPPVSTETSTLPPDTTSIIVVEETTPPQTGAVNNNNSGVKIQRHYLMTMSLTLLGVFAGAVL